MQLKGWQYQQIYTFRALETHVRRDAATLGLRQDNPVQCVVKDQQHYLEHLLDIFQTQQKLSHQGPQMITAPKGHVWGAVWTRVRGRPILDMFVWCLESTHWKIPRTIHLQYCTETNTRKRAKTGDKHSFVTYTCTHTHTQAKPQASSFHALCYCLPMNPSLV